ncbi:MAG: hypothetical protein KIT83_07420 [Bryobacterales bacterium]|nr:hypothetical protein [Bryobacterales bacterium]
MESLEGKGIVSTESGETATVSYYLEVWREVIPTPIYQDPHADMLGLFEVHGHIEPMCFGVGENLVLTLNDGRTFPLFVQNSHGNISPMGGISE